MSGAELAAALIQMQRDGYTIAGKHYRRVPNGYDPQHPRAALLRHNGLYASPLRLAPQDVIRPGVVDRCAAHMHAMAPSYHWLCQIAKHTPE